MEKIVFFEIEEWEKKQIENAFKGYHVVFREDSLTEETVSEIRDATIVSFFVYSRATQEILSMLPYLKMIATRSVGTDHIDLSYCKEKGITVFNIPVYGIDTIAEHTFALILSLSRKIIQSVENTRKGNFDLTNLRGLELAHKTLGVVGAGHIGKKVIEIARAFGMNILIFSHHKDEEFLGKKDIKFVDLNELLSCSDVISLHIPLVPETTHIINSSNINLIKRGSLLINTARGGLIETQAILDGLEKGILSGVGLDVLEGECFIREERELLSTKFLEKCDLKTQLLDHMLLNREDVLVTPHNAFNSKEALENIITVTIDNINSYLHPKT